MSYEFTTMYWLMFLLGMMIVGLLWSIQRQLIAITQELRRGIDAFITVQERHAEGQKNREMALLGEVQDLTDAVQLMREYMNKVDRDLGIRPERGYDQRQPSYLPSPGFDPIIDPSTDRNKAPSP
jgi:hypothetical protein